MLRAREFSAAQRPVVPRTIYQMQRRSRVPLSADLPTTPLFRKQCPSFVIPPFSVHVEVAYG